MQLLSKDNASKFPNNKEKVILRSWKWSEMINQLKNTTLSDTSAEMLICLPSLIQFLNVL